MKPSDSQVVDHINGNGLDNRRENLRIATMSSNQWNQRKQRRCTKSKFKGVGLDDRTNKWSADIRAYKQRFYLGSFVLEEDAAMAYDAAARKLHGEFARLNFPTVEERSALELKETVQP